MGYCDPKEVRKGRAWYQVANDPIPPHVLALYQMSGTRIGTITNGTFRDNAEYKAWCDELSED